jgi:hypothetical protein
MQSKPNYKISLGVYYLRRFYYGKKEDKFDETAAGPRSIHPPRSRLFTEQEGCYA